MGQKYILRLFHTVYPCSRLSYKSFSVIFKPYFQDINCIPEGIESELHNLAFSHLIIFISIRRKVINDCYLFPLELL